MDHALWELLSAAFSYIRDHHTEDAVSLEQFLSVATQVVPIVPAAQYFARCGFRRAGDILEKITVSPQEMPKATSISCVGLVRYCHRQRLISMPPVDDEDRSADGRERCSAPSTISFAAIQSLSSACVPPNLLETSLSGETTQWVS